MLVYGDEGRFCSLYFFRDIYRSTIDRPRWVRTNLDTLFSPNGVISYQGGEWQCNGYGAPTISGDSIPSAIHLLTSTGDTLRISREEIRFVGSGVIELDSTAVERIRSVELIDGSMEIWREGTLDSSTGFLQDHGRRRLSRSGLLLLGKVLLIVDDKYLVLQQWHER